MSLTLVGGGARSGKSSHALRLARSCGSRLAFIATARAEDDEMRERIRVHTQQRGQEFITFEEPRDVAGRIAAERDRFDALVVDCLTLWVSNLLLAHEVDIEREFQQIVDSAVNARARVFLVTNEVGCGIVPDNALARRFRDLTGKLNQQAAEAADAVFWMVFGIPLQVK